MPKIYIVHYEEDPEAIVQFRLDSIYNWDDHLNFTRDAIISILAGSDDRDAIIDRLSQNQVDIGNMLVPYYGTDAASALTTLLNTHIGIASNIIQSTKSGRNTNDLKSQWTTNAQQIADYLNTLDPVNWPTDSTMSALQTHMDCTLQELDARMKKDWVGDIAAYDLAHKSIVSIAEYFSRGIINNFPEKFIKYDTYITPSISPTIANRKR